MTKRASTREWVGLGVLAGACALISANSNLLNLALPSLTADLRPSAVEVLWVSDSYVFAVAALLIPMGLLADRFGRRRMLMIGAALFGLASVGAAVSPDAAWLIACRAGLWAAGAMLSPSTISLLRSMFHDGRQRTVALSIWTGGFALGGVLGPLIGGGLLSLGGWRAVFLVTPPAMLVVLIASPLLLPEHRAAQTRRVDVVGISTAIAGILALVWATKQLAAGQPGGPLVVVVGIGVGGVGLLVAFALWERRARDPAIDLELFRDRDVAIPLIANALAFAVLYGNQLLTGQYLQSVLGMPALLAGAWTIPGAAAYALGGLAVPRLMRRFTASAVLVAGLVASSTGFALQAAVGLHNGVLPFVLGSSIAAAGLAPVYLVTTQSTVDAVSVDRAGIAGSTLETVTNVGGAVGIAVFGSIAAAIFRGGAGVAGSSPSTIGEAVARAAGSDAGHRALLVAQQAFVDGFRATALIGGGLLLGSAVAAAVILGRSAQGSSRRGDPGDLS